ncbi:hypothetical protein DSJ_22360 [Pantoea stewartii subsp. stewartii DC283]|uniref:Uncharacterized protein n=1 Tax=Pantoea stewartii subsp. stewartii DC283 TaxID=660596 RepID=A0ABM6KAI5_PANSE|nr:hypothetical protein DSJ_22360 [Pantoea stewartii subsp. stewartii DC283]
MDLFQKHIAGPVVVIITPLRFHGVCHQEKTAAYSQHRDSDDRPGDAFREPEQPALRSDSTMAGVYLL